MTRHFCTMFDHNYLTRGLVLFDSLTAQLPDVQLYCLCLDAEAYQRIAEIAKTEPRIQPIALEALETSVHGLLEAKGNRSKIEYFFTLSPVLPLYVLEKFELPSITLLDADLQFFQSPEVIFDELGAGSVLITEHRHSQNLLDQLSNGIYNVQYETFVANESGLACLRQWQADCLAWCYDRLEDGKFADQAYLDSWPEAFDGVVVSRNPGVGVALWNLGDHPLVIKPLGMVSQRTNASPVGVVDTEWEFEVDGAPLVFFHFHSFRHVYRRIYMNDFSVYQVPKSEALLELYRGYARALDQVADRYSVPRYHGLANARSRLPVWAQLIKQALKRNLILT